MRTLLNVFYKMTILRQCGFLGCSSQEGQGIKMHRFPLNGPRCVLFNFFIKITNYNNFTERWRLWVQATQNSLLQQYTQEELESKKIAVCGRHFDEQDFTRPGDRNSRLISVAVPKPVPSHLDTSLPDIDFEDEEHKTCDVASQVLDLNVKF